VRPVVVDEARALIIQCRTAHLRGPAGDGVDGSQRFEERVFPGKCAFFFQDIELFVRFGDDAFPNGGGDLLQTVTDMESIEECDVEETGRTALMAPPCTFHAVLFRRGVELIAGQLEEL